MFCKLLRNFSRTFLCVYQQCHEERLGGINPHIEIKKAFGGTLSPLLQTYVKLDKFLAKRLPKEDRGKVHSYR